MPSKYTKLDWYTGNKEIDANNYDYMEEGIIDAQTEANVMSDIGLSDASFTPSWDANALIIINAMNNTGFDYGIFYISNGSFPVLTQSLYDSNTVVKSGDGLLEVILSRNGYYNYYDVYTNQFQYHHNNSAYTRLFGAYDNSWLGWSQINMTAT